VAGDTTLLAKKEKGAEPNAFNKPNASTANTNASPFDTIITIHPVFICFIIRLLLTS
jgi:hypothetical protein